MMKPSLTQIGLVATLLAAPAKALAADFATNVVTSVAADLLIGGGYVSAPLGIAVGYGNGKLTLADRTSSALYAGARVTTDFENPRLGDYFIEVGTFGGTSTGSFRNLDSLIGTGSGTGTSYYTLNESLVNAYVGRRLMRDQGPDSYAIPDWQVLARVGFTYVDCELNSTFFGTNEVASVPGGRVVVDGVHVQDSRDWLSNVGLRADISIRDSTRRIFERIGLRQPSQARLVLDGEVSAGVRNAAVTENLQVSSDPQPINGNREQTLATYGGVGRLTVLLAFEIRESWNLVVNSGIQSRYMWVNWDDIPDRGGSSRPRSNVRGNELLWGPYIQIGVQHQW